MEPEKIYNTKILERGWIIEEERRSNAAFNSYVECAAI
jgi:hypothetical protein